MKKLDLLWKYEYLDKSTWKYIDCVISGDTEPYVSKWILNPKFKYGHLEKKHGQSNRK